MSSPCTPISPYTLEEEGDNYNKETIYVAKGIEEAYTRETPIVQGTLVRGSGLEKLVYIPI